jgi:hypothetical protein
MGEAREFRTLSTLGLWCCLLASPASEAAEPAQSNPAAARASAPTVKQEQGQMWMTVGERRYAFSLADTEAARAFAALLPLTIEMPDLNDNEKHAELPKALPTSASRPGTIRNGDVMLYGSRTLVVFYKTFDSAYAYTRLGRVDDPAGLAQALGPGTASITFTKK